MYNIFLTPYYKNKSDCQIISHGVGQSIELYGSIVLFSKGTVPHNFAVWYKASFLVNSFKLSLNFFQLRRRSLGNSDQIVLSLACSKVLHYSKI